MQPVIFEITLPEQELILYTLSALPLFLLIRYLQKIVPFFGS